MAGGAQVITTSAISIGSVVDTIKGVVDPKLREKWFTAKDYLYGFEAASPKGLSSIGESVLVNGTCYATSSDQVIYGEKFVTGGIFLLPKGAKPSCHLTMDNPIDLEGLIDAIYDKVKRPVAFVGLLQSETLNTIAIAKPPIDGLNIFENKQYYFPNPPKLLHKVPCFVIGVITSYSDPKWKDLNKQLEVVLYKNPFDKESTLTSHTHCLVLKPGVTQIKEIIPSTVEKCLHLFIDKTTIKSGRLDLFALDQVVAF